MPIHQRQFSRERSRATSRAHSQNNFSSSFSLNSSLLNKLHELQHNCLTCTNNYLAESKLRNQKQRQKQQKYESLQTLSKINSTRDLQKQMRRNNLLQAIEFNKSMISSQKKSQRDLRFYQESQSQKMIEKIEKDLSERELQQKNSRISLKQKYRIELKQQIKAQRQRKQLEHSRLKSQDPSLVSQLKILQENEKYVMRSNLSRKNTSLQNKGLILQKSLARHQQKERSLIEENKHLQTVENQFKKYTQFMGKEGSPYEVSRLSLKSSQNPEDVFSYLKKMESDKLSSIRNEREEKKKLRAIQLKRIEQENRVMLKKKISSMKNYVQELTGQLMEKRKKKREEQELRKYFKPEKSKVDYFTQELRKEKSQCGSCDRLIEKKTSHGYQARQIQ